MDFNKNDLPESINALSKQVLDAAYRVHLTVGPGLYESVYEACFAKELTKKGLLFAQQKPIPLNYDGDVLETAFRADFIVANTILVELKAVEKLLPLHKTQVKTYLKLSNLQLGLLVNFNTELLGPGVQRIVLTKHASDAEGFKGK